LEIHYPDLPFIPGKISSNKNQILHLQIFKMDREQKVTIATANLRYQSVKKSRTPSLLFPVIAFDQKISCKRWCILTENPFSAVPMT